MMISQRAVVFGLVLAAASYAQLDLASPTAAAKPGTKSESGQNSAKKNTNGKKANQQKKSSPEVKPKSNAKSKTPAKKAKSKPAPVTKAWSKEQITQGRQLCQQLLSKLDIIAIPEASFRKGACGTAAPVRLVAVGTSPQVVLSPPAIMTCRLAAAVHRWTTQDLQRLAKKHLKDEIIRIEVMSDYSCRNTYGRKIGKLSEHGLANALDIRGFSTASGKVVRLLSSWGPTARDIAAEKARAEETRRAQLEAERVAEEEAALREAEQQNQETGVGRKKTAKQIVVKSTEKLLKVGDKLATAAKKALAKGAALKAPTLPLSKRISQQGYFLRAAHKAACKRFGTTLGPEANHAHRNHFHVDMRARRRSNYCE